MAVDHKRAGTEILTVRVGRMTATMIAKDAARQGISVSSWIRCAIWGEAAAREISPVETVYDG